ncbi:MAG: methionine adenosyltransferase [Micromonosporaceae bacterium]|nr:methionine adenosyltransferase [Micromonosporaceae bacterium]
MNILTATGLPATAACGMELVERKGSGHPDTLADGVAEAISRAYSRYCLDRFEAILHHNTDKTALLGGSAEVRFGHGRMTAPIMVLVNGRITRALGAQKIPVADIVTTTVRDHLAQALPLLDVDRWVRVRQRLTAASSPGGVAGPTSDQQAGRQYWFAPRSLDDLAELRRMFANDTSAGVGYAPLGPAEQLALAVETELSSAAFRQDHQYCGTDIKLMVVRHDADIHLTACVPQIAAHTADLDTYLARRAAMQQLIGQLAQQSAPDHRIEVSINTRDDVARQEVYLTAIGSSIESGDEGVVGRGNRANGLISMLRPMSMEGVSGKNPVYHVGKLYNLAATRTAEHLFALTGRVSAVCLVSQAGRDLDDPWQVLVWQSGDSSVDTALAERVVKEVMGDLDDLRAALLDGRLATA